MCAPKPIELVGGVPAELLAAIPAKPTELDYQNRLQALKAVSGRHFFDRGDWMLGTWRRRDGAVEVCTWELYVPDLIQVACREPGKWAELRAIAFLRLNMLKPAALDICEDNGIALIRIQAWEPDMATLTPWVEQTAVNRVFPDLALTLRQYLAGNEARANLLGY